jgi:hypothetical protein
MALSEYDFNVTRNEIIERAYRIIGKHSMGETVSGEMLTQAVIALNAMVKAWQSRNCFLWTLREFTQTLSANIASYSLAAVDPPILAIDSAYLRINNLDEPVDVASWRQYVDIPDKTAKGDPTVLALNTAITPTLYVWPVPTQTRTLYCSAIVRLKDFDTAGGNPDFPVRYIEALTYGLAHALSYEYGLPLAERRDLENQAIKTFQEAKVGDRERAEFEFCEGAHNTWQRRYR